MISPLSQHLLPFTMTSFSFSALPTASAASRSLRTLISRIPLPRSSDAVARNRFNSVSL